VEKAPIAAGRLLNRAGLLIGDGTAAGDPVEFAQELLLLHGVRLRIDLGRLLSVAGLRADEQRKKRKRSNDSAEFGDERRHGTSSYEARIVDGNPRSRPPCHRGQVAMVSR
jgi:hypothetical protein